jgi:hypothetical protein
MLRPSSRPVSSYLDKPLRTLYDACRELGQDDNGRACASCPLWHLCVTTRVTGSWQKSSC